MSSTIVIAIVVALGEAKNPGTLALLAATRESLAEGASVRLVERAGVDGDVDAGAIEREEGAGATVVVFWNDLARLHAVMRVHFAATDRWFSRKMDFLPADTLAERGRTLGLAAASIWPDARPLEARRRSGEPPPPRQVSAAPVPPAPSPREDDQKPATVTTPTTASAPAPPPPESERWVPESLPNWRPEPERRRARAEEDATVTAAATVRGPIEEARDGSGASDQGPQEAERPAVPWKPHTFAVALNGSGALGVGGPASGLGGVLRGVFFPVSLGLGICAGAGLRDGPVPLLTGTIRMASFSLGLEWWPGDGALRSGVDAPAPGWAFGLRVEALGTYHHVVADNPETDGRSPWLKPPHAPVVGGQVMGQARFRLTRVVQLSLAAGGELMIGGIDVKRKDPLHPNDRDFDTSVVTIAPFRLLAELGVRITF